jgi:hypothetical protein
MNGKEDVVLELFHHKKIKILSFVASHMELEIMLSEISQAQKDKYQMISFICGVFLKR